MVRNGNDTFSQCNGNVEILEYITPLHICKLVSLILSHDLVIALNICPHSTYTFLFLNH